MSVLIRAGERGVDFSFAHPPAARLVELGYTFVVGYLSVPPASSAKNLTKAECDAYIAAGLAVLLVWEMSATRATLGASYGTADGANARAQAQARDHPIDVPILIADDTSTTTANLGNKIAYMQAAAAALQPFDIAIYGGVKILAPLVGLWRIGWVPITAWSWSVSLGKLAGETPAAYNARGRAAATVAAREVGAHCLQDTGFYIDNTWAVDPNVAIADFPAWGNPRPDIEEDEMTLSLDDIYKDAETQNDKFALMIDGTLRPLSAVELVTRGITLSLALGKPLDRATRDLLGYYKPATSSTQGAVGPQGDRGPAGATGAAGQPGADSTGDVTGTFKGQVT